MVKLSVDGSILTMVGVEHVRCRDCEVLVGDESGLAC